MNEPSNRNDEQIVDDASKDLIDYITQFLPNVCLTKVKKALAFAITAHANQKRASGEPYVTHPIEVAKIIAELHLDTETIVCALLHDVAEDTEYTTQDIEAEFGEKYARIVDGLTKINRIECQNFLTKKSENLRKLLIAVAEDARVLLIKLADRLHNMRTLSCIADQRKRMRIAKDTIDIYAPLAERIGIHFFKNILYDLAFEVLYPQVRKSIIHQVNILKEQGQNDIRKIVTDIADLMKENKVDVDVKGREKTPFSIWQKMERKKIYFDELSDIFAVRIIAKSTIDCYVTLGIIHTHYKVFSKEFFDYVSTPKQNGYMSIHTVVMITDSVKVEIQIRTSEMHHISELGMAAHWIYKNENDSIRYEYQQEWLKKIRSIMENIADTNDIISSVKLEMYYDQVFCFTPKGDVISLPKNSTPLDFAFEVSVDLGSRYSKALVNGKNASITTHLQSGDHVEIFTANHITITHYWLDIVNTSKAKTEIQIYLEKKLFESIVLSGNLSIYDECEKYQLNVNNDKLQKVAEHYNININELLFHVGNGTIDSDDIISKLSRNSIREKLHHIIKKKFKYAYDIKNRLKTLSNLQYNSEIQFSYCCNPTIDNIGVGIYNSDNKSIIIHSNDCHNIHKTHPNEELYSILLSDSILNVNNIQIEVVMFEYQSSLAVFNILTEFGISQYKIDVRPTDESTVAISLDLTLIIPHQLEALINKIKNISGIIDISVL